MSDFVYLSSFLCYVTLNLSETSVVKSRPSVPHGANFFYLIITLLVYFLTYLATPSRPEVIGASRPGFSFFGDSFYVAVYFVTDACLLCCACFSFSVLSQETG